MCQNVQTLSTLPPHRGRARDLGCESRRDQGKAGNREGGREGGRKGGREGGRRGGRVEGGRKDRVLGVAVVPVDKISVGVWGGDEGGIPPPIQVPSKDLCAHLERLLATIPSSRTTHTPTGVACEGHISDIPLPIATGVIRPALGGRCAVAARRLPGVAVRSNALGVKSIALGILPPFPLATVLALQKTDVDARREHPALLLHAMLILHKVLPLRVLQAATRGRAFCLCLCARRAAASVGGRGGGTVALRLNSLCAGFMAHHGGGVPLVIAGQVDRHRPA